ncbi:DUF4087 domain-containing protein [Lysobacter enzymogenes]|uniref:DUF4087 domain-containing protein n=1 Tax=Lysobacter enzymogenes TaxID=69 RepID=A0A3N2RPL8_LYSEN|nr:DUF4087 domain-containing protein [Lysobacter enzymogenes]ROU09423.1 DUF4087 domain-containing protein [Lysobacter enzymogenes]
MSLRTNIAAIAALLLAFGTAAAHPSGAELRCGWFDNPTPGNASLYDRDGEWTIAIQGGYQAKGDWPPEYPPGQWRATNAGGHGYGCACFKVRVDAEEKNILEIFSSKARPLSACRKDPALKGIERRHL